MSMRAGGTVSGELWLTRVRNLRPGDYVRVGNWSGECWVSGEPLEVIEPPELIPRSGGYFDIKVQVPTDPKNWRVLCILGDDQVQLAARDAVREKPVEINPPAKKQRKPKKGQQLKLFDDD